VVQEPEPNLNRVLEVEFLGKKSLEPGVNWQLIVGVRTRLSRSQSDFQNQNLNFFQEADQKQTQGSFSLWNPKVIAIRKYPIQSEDRVASEVA